MNWDEVKTELQKPLDPSAIKPPPQGKYGEYVDGLHVIREANRIFGEDGWSYEVTRLEMASRIEDSNAKVRVSYLCGVRASVGGVIREGLAVGIGIAKQDSEGDAHESAVKEAETDALKRALRTFGNTFGLALYEKDKAKREVGVPAPPAPPASEIRDRIKAAIFRQSTQQKLDDMWMHEATQNALSDLPQPMKLELTKAYNDRRKEVPDDPARQAPQEAAA